MQFIFQNSPLELRWKKEENSAKEERENAEHSGVKADIKKVEAKQAVMIKGKIQRWKDFLRIHMFDRDDITEEFINEKHKGVSPPTEEEMDK